MADANLTKRIADLEAEIERLKASRPPRRRVASKLTESRLQKLGEAGGLVGDGNNSLYKCASLGRDTPKAPMMSMAADLQPSRRPCSSEQ